MNVNWNLFFILLHISVLVVLFFIILVWRMENKQQIHYVIMIDMILVFIWCIGQLFEVYSRSITGSTNMIFVYIYFFGVCFLPLSLLYTGVIFAKTKIKFNYIDIFFALPPLISYVILLTNEYHHLFFVRYSHINSQLVYGNYFIFHNISTYVYIILGLGFLLFFSIRNSGFFSKQSLLIILGIFIPFTFNIMITYKIITVPTYTTAITFTAGIICFLIAIMKLKFLNIVPIALQSVVDIISDSFVVINENGTIIDYNKPFYNNFGEKLNIDRSDNFKDFTISLNKCSEKFIDMDLVDSVILNNKSHRCECRITIDSKERYYDIEITPINLHGKSVGVIIMFKDITELKKSMEKIKRNQEILTERERLASLGQLIGGIAHNMRTPIMCISGAVRGLDDLILEYRESIEDPEVTIEDHYEIADEMFTWTKKILPHCSYMSDIISAVKDQAVSMNNSSISTSFTIKELLNRVDLLMKHELKKYHCKLQVTNTIDPLTKIKGHISSMVQILDNIIINAIYAYKGEKGCIYFRINKRDDMIVFSLEDKGMGIPKNIQKKLFKEMITTKGKQGTGLGLYMSYSTIKGHFGGNMYFESEVNKGTTFHIEIPIPD